MNQTNNNVPFIGWQGLIQPQDLDFIRIEQIELELLGGWLSTNHLGLGSNAATNFTGYIEYKTDADISVTNDTIATLISIQTGAPVSFYPNYPVGTGIGPGIVLYAINIDATHIKLATSLSNAIAGTAIDITGLMGASGTRGLHVLDRIATNADLSGQLQKSWPIKFTNNGAVKQNNIVAVSSSIIQIAPGYISTIGDSILDPTSNGMTNVYYSPSPDPYGFPEWFNYPGVYGANGSMTFTSVVTNYAKYKISGRLIAVNGNAIGTIGGTVNNTLTGNLPIASAAGAIIISCNALVNSGPNLGFGSISNSTVSLKRYDGSNFVSGASQYFIFNALYEW